MRGVVGTSTRLAQPPPSGKPSPPKGSSQTGATGTLSADQFQSPIEQAKLDTSSAVFSRQNAERVNVEEIQRILAEINKVSWLIATQSRRSESLDYNSLKVPSPATEFEYNFYEPNEEDVASNEDPDGDPLLSLPPHRVPRIAELSWPTLSVSEAIAGSEEAVAENRQVRNDFFVHPEVGMPGSSPPRGSPALAGNQAIVVDGVPRQITDTHNLALAFESVNNDALFPNAVVAEVSLQPEEEIANVLRAALVTPAKPRWKFK